ncbi:hypothetical protein FB99_45950 (plasmid) [Pantoea agglomerans]|nr:hypothetical protein FB99_45950 [Pantoea agglomerans]
MHVQGKKYSALLLFRLTYSGNNTQLSDANHKSVNPYLPVRPR